MGETAIALSFWHWLVIGLMLMLVELVLPSTYFLWLGVAAMLVGLLLWLLPSMSFDVQLILFAALSVSTIFLGRRYLKRHPIDSDQPTLNVRGAQSIGRLATLREPIVNGVGRVHLDDTLWRALGEDMPSGSQVRVVAVEGTSLRVEAVEPRDTGSSSGASQAHEHDNDADGSGGD